LLDASSVRYPAVDSETASTRNLQPSSSFGSIYLMNMMTLGERCDACGSTTSLPATLHAVPRIEIECLDMAPFSESFSGLFENEDDDDYDNESDDHEMIGHENDYRTDKTDLSYNVEQISWDDEDIAEVMILSPKPQRYSTLPTISEEHDGSSIVSSEAHFSQSPPEDSAVTLADFDIIPTSGHPMLCKKRTTNKVYVIKALDPGPHTEKLVMESIRALRAPFIERVYWTFPGVADGEEGRVYLVLESHWGGDLATLVNSKSLAPADVLLYVCEVVEGVSSLHAVNIIHRDLTPSNIFVDHTGHIVLSNFSNAAMISAGAECGIPLSAAVEYQAPEILLGWAHDFAVDCWSFGLLLHFLLAGTNPLPGDNGLDGQGRARSQILLGNVVLSDIPQPEAQDLIRKCLERNPVLRLSIGRIREHDYFSTVDWQEVRQKTMSPPTRSRIPSPKLRPTSRDFPLPPAPHLSLASLDPSLDISFTFHTASKAVPSQPRIERVPVVNDTTRPPLRSSYSMEELRSRHRRRYSLPSKSTSTPLLPERLIAPYAGTSSSLLADFSTADSRRFASCLSVHIQTPECLPSIFRSTLLDDRLVEEEERTPSALSTSSPTVCELTPRERMAQFWERLDADPESASSVASLELRDALRLALPCPPLPTSRSRRPVPTRASTADPVERFSIFSATQATSSKLRKLRRPLSTPLLAKRSEPVLNLPPGVVQIGKGIGFTYKMPVASHSKASICTTPAHSVATRLLRGGLGLGKGLMRRDKAQSKVAPSGVAARRAHGPPGRIQPSPRLASTVTLGLGLHSPVSEGPLTPDSLAFPPLPEIANDSDPFAKDLDPRDGPATLRLVHVAPSEYDKTLDNFIFSGWNT
ncbi:kinase-like domain-containing protein, partial [Mycena vitilis]